MLYSKKGTYLGYDKNNKEREALDYYSTPTEEVKNILDTISLPFTSEDVILEPCAGGGHMVKGIYEHLEEAESFSTKVIATDIQNRNSSFDIHTGKEFDFLSDNYPVDKADYVIMNPPYSVIEPFCMKSLEIAKKGVLMLGRLQFLEGEKRYLNIFKDCPPTDVYVYTDRISCYKNGDTSQKLSSTQAYAWFYWDMTQKAAAVTRIHWIRRVDKKEG